MNAADLDALYAQAQDEAVDGLMRSRFATEPREDLSGMFTGRSPLAFTPSESEPPAAGGSEPTMPELHQGPRGAAADDDNALVDAWTARYFPGSVG